MGSVILQRIPGASCKPRRLTFFTLEGHLYFIIFFIISLYIHSILRNLVFLNHKNGECGSTIYQQLTPFIDIYPNFIGSPFSVMCVSYFCCRWLIALFTSIDSVGGACPYRKTIQRHPTHYMRTPCPLGAEVLPFLWNRPRDDFRFPALPVAFFYMVFGISGITYAFTVRFLARAVLRCRMSSVSPNKSISGDGAIYYHFIWPRGEAIALRILRRSPIQRRAPIGRVSCARLSGVLASTLDRPAATSYWYGTPCRSPMFDAPTSRWVRPPNFLGLGAAATLDFGEYIEFRPRYMAATHAYAGLLGQWPRPSYWVRSTGKTQEI